jgi:uncharacterized protein (TIGR01370 family)
MLPELMITPVPVPVAGADPVLMRGDRAGLAIMAWRKSMSVAIHLACGAAGGTRFFRRPLLAATALSALVVLGWTPHAGAQPAPTARPTGGQVSAGTAPISQLPDATIITQSSQRVVVNSQGQKIVTPKTGMYVLQGVDPAAVAAAPFDIKVIEIYNDNGQLFTPVQVAQMGGGPGNGLLLGYFSIGEAEVWRDYYNTIPKAVIGPEDPQWPGCYQVAYWTPDWKSVASAYIDRMIQAGYDGVYFDIVDEYQLAWAKNNVPSGDAAGAMVNLIKSLRDYAHTKNPNFKIWVNGGEELLDNSTYIQSIDGMYKEEVFYSDSGNIQPASESSWAVNQLHKAIAAGKDVVVVEYVTGATKVADVHAKAAAAGFGSYIAHLDLNGIDTEGILPGQTGEGPATTTN